jgi:hypothetical protein
MTHIMADMTETMNEVLALVIRMLSRDLLSLGAGNCMTGNVPLQCGPRSSRVCRPAHN